MKKSLTKTVVAAVIVTLLATVAPMPATAASGQQGVANYKMVLENCYAYGEVLDRLNKEMEVAKVSLGRQLMAENNAVRRRQLTQQFEDNYTRRRSELAKPLFEQVKLAVVQVAKEYGLSRVEDSATGAKGIDVTQAVIAKLNSFSAAQQYALAPVAPAPAQQQPARRQHYAQQPQQYAQAPAQQQYQQPQYQQPVQQQQYTQAPAQQQMEDPFAQPQQQPQMSRKARKAAAKAAKAQRKAEKLAAKAQAAQNTAQQYAQAPAAQPAAAQQPAAPVAAAPAASAPATAEDQAIAQASTNIDNMIAELNRPKAPASKGIPFTPQPAVGKVPAQRSFTASESGRRYVAPSVEVSGNEVTIGEEAEETAPKAARKTAAKQKNRDIVKAVRPKRTLAVADVPAKAEPNSAAEAAGRQRRATRATQNVKAAPAEYRGSAKGSIEVQFGADYDKPDITRMVNLAKRNGISNAYVLETTSQKTGKLFWRARVPAANKAEAQALSRKLSAIGLSNYITDAR